MASAATEAIHTQTPHTTGENDNVDTSPKESSEEVSSPLETTTEIEQQEDANIDEQPQQSTTDVAKVQKPERPTNYPEPYYFPNVPPMPSFGRGIRKILKQWLTDNPGLTEEHFWDCQLRRRRQGIPVGITGEDRLEYDNETERFQDAQE